MESYNPGCTRIGSFNADVADGRSDNIAGMVTLLVGDEFMVRGATAEADSEADQGKRPFRDFGFLVIGIVGLLIRVVHTVDGSVSIGRAMTRLRLQ